MRCDSIRTHSVFSILIELDENLEKCLHSETLLSILFSFLALHSMHLAVLPTQEQTKEERCTPVDNTSVYILFVCISHRLRFPSIALSRYRGHTV